MSPFTISLAAFVCVVGGVLLGTRGHSLLPDDHRSQKLKKSSDLEWRSSARWLR